MRKANFYQKSGATFAFNPWDLLALVIILGFFVLLAYGATQMSKPFDIGVQQTISLNPLNLPLYGLQSVLRMLIALSLALVFTLLIGTLAAKNKHAERIIVPAIDILQSVPVLGYLSITVSGFIALFPGSLWGPEMCCIFVLFTAQVWNMTLGFYQSLKIIPYDLIEASRMFNLNPWQRFWRIEVPFAMPNLLWNMMMSMSQSWVFLVFNEAIQVAKQNIKLPGIGSYIFVALQKADIHAIVYAIIAMFVIIFLYDQLMFRPLLKWAEKFKADKMPDEKPNRAWFTSLLQRAQLIRYFGNIISKLGDAFINIRFSQETYLEKHQPKVSWLNKTLTITFYTVIIAVLLIAAFLFVRFIFSTLSWANLWHVFLLTLASALRVVATILISSLVWVPVGVWIGRNNKLAKLAQPIVQFCAAFPANLIYPLAILLILKYHFSINIWSTALIIMGAQWYILFNVIAGTSTMPKEIYYAARNFDVKGWLWWKRVVIPGIFPYYVTGAITAAGGAWNLTIVAELLHWGSHTLSAFGIGAYITHYTNIGDFHRIALGIGMMCLFVLLFNWLVWRPLYNLAETRFRIN
jgi:NitT/TauT family transport system permease protein